MNVKVERKTLRVLSGAPATSAGVGYGRMYMHKRKGMTKQISDTRRRAEVMTVSRGTELFIMAGVGTRLVSKPRQIRKSREDIGSVRFSMF